jgi:hypothetical protein
LGLYKKIFFVSFVIIAVGFVIINTNAWNLLGKPINLGLIPETAVIRKVSFDSANNNTLLLDVQSMYSKTIFFNTVVLKNLQHNTVATIASFESELPAEKNTIITVDLSGINLSSGNYTVDLWTTRSHFFSSPSFTIR